MLKISHRGNIEGKKEEHENSPSYIIDALQAGFQCEVDVWCIDKKLFLGHDAPHYPTTDSFLERPTLWIHCKNLEAIEYFTTKSSWFHFHYFWHQNDKLTMTSKGVPWVYSGIVVNKGVLVLPELFPEIVTSIRARSITPSGVCCDDFGWLD